MMKSVRKPIALQIALLTASTALGSMSLHAQERATLEEVVVTAEKREESLQDVSISISAFNEEALRLGGVDDVSRLELLVPGLNYAFAGNDAKFNVRGIPTLLVFKNGTVEATKVGALSKAQLVEFVDSIL